MSSFVYLSLFSFPNTHAHIYCREFVKQIILIRYKRVICAYSSKQDVLFGFLNHSVKTFFSFTTKNLLWPSFFLPHLLLYFHFYLFHAYLANLFHIRVSLKERFHFNS